MKKKQPDKIQTPPQEKLSKKFKDGKIPFEVMMKLAVNTSTKKKAKK